MPDVRNAIDALEQSEPLYGFLQYRRRKIVLNYLPDDLSRLVKARTTVQFQSVLDKFSPHDTIFSIAKSSDLTESALSSACLLHAASGSITSSSSSLRRRRLMEITEDAEENASDNHDAQSLSPASGDSIHHRPYSQRSDATLVAPTRTPSKLQHSTTSDHLPPPTTESIAPPETETTAPPERPPSITPSVTFDDTVDRPPSQRQHAPDELSRVPSESRRMSSQSSRLSIREDFASLYTPKVKRAPRPSVDSSGRPRASGNFSRNQEQRPVAALPAGVRPSPLRKFGGGSGASNSPRPRSQGSTVASSSASARGSPVPAVPSLLMPPVPMPIPRSQASSGAKSLSAVTTSGMTPEKERLMKALQQRKKQMEKRAAPNKQSQPVPPSSKGQEDLNGENKENHVEEREPNHDQDMTNNRPITITTAIPVAAPAAAASPVHDRSKHGTEPPTTSTEAQSGSTPDSCKEAPGPCVSPEQPKPDSAVDLVVSDSEGDQPSITSPPSTTPTTTNTTATTLSVDHHNNDIDEIDEDNNKGLREEDEANDERQEQQGDEARAETPQATGPIEENQPHPGDIDSLPAAIATPAPAETQDAGDSKEPDGPRSPSALDDPLEEKSRTAAEDNNNNTTNNEIGVAPPSAKLPPDSHQPVDAAATQNTPEPNPTPEDPSPVVVHTSSIPIVSVDSQQQHDLPVPESSHPVEQQDTLAVHKKKNRRKPLLEPIHVPTPEHSDEDNLLSDDSFMEELKSATVQEAKPVSVGSPIYPGYDNEDDHHIHQVMSSTSDTFGGSRAVSNPSTTGESQLGNLHAGMGTARSVSSNYPPAAIDPMSPALVARKVNVSSGISKRIKALEKFTGNQEVPATGISPPHLAGMTSSNSLDTFRRRTSISKESGHSKSPSLSRSPSYSVVDPSSQTPPEISRDNSYSSLNNGTQAANSVSVTARIIRDRDSTSPNPSNRNSLNLHASPLTVEHGTSSPEPVPEEEEKQEEETEAEERNASASASPPTSSPNPAAAIPRSESQMSGTSQTKGDGDEKAEKRSSRTSRIFSRMSSITANPRRSFLGALSPSPSIKEPYDLSPSEKEPEIAPEPEHQAIDIGEVNVQFPDTLLWKRRFIRVDEKGYLVLAPANVESTGRNMTKRYHLAEFRTPCLPDEDRQELPNSILLDFLDGSTLQCACESRQGQSAILESMFSILQEFNVPPYNESMLTIFSPRPRA